MGLKSFVLVLVSLKLVANLVQSIFPLTLAKNEYGTYMHLVHSSELFVVFFSLAYSYFPFARKLVNKYFALICIVAGSFLLLNKFFFFFFFS